MKKFLLSVLLRNEQLMKIIVIECLRHLARKSESPIDDELVEALALFLQDGNS